ncbi:MAG TPA: PAS domain S-box protein [Actinobacteria bacterium]|nr:PAS domain S-box protein [Actinomycetota bacterium]
MARSSAGDQDADVRLRDLEAMLDAIADYEIIKLDVDGTVASWSPGAQALKGYTAQEIIGQPVSVFYTAEDQAAGLAQRELDMAGDTGRFEVEGWRVRKDGGRFWASVILTPIRAHDGKLAGYVKVTRDISERRNTDDMFRGLLESAPEAMLLVGPDGRIVLANRQAEHLFGFGRDELTATEVERLMPARFRERHPGHRAGFFAAAEPRPMGMGLELSGQRRDGSEFPVEISLSPVQTDRGALVAAAIRDVTERRATELRLERQRDEILELSTPVIRVWDKVLALPIIGTLDSGRAARLTEGLLEKIAETQAEVIILELSGVPTIDTQVAQHLLKTVQAAALMGAVSIMSGMRPEIAQAMVHLGIDMGQIRSRSTLRDALQLAMQTVRGRAGPAFVATTAVSDGPQ